MKKFALIGAAGFIAPRHLKAIKENNGDLVAAVDKHDNVGVLDSYFPNADFFTEFERFDRHLDKLKRKGEKVDYISICSPNYLHDSHIRFTLRAGAEAICEKPLVLNPWNLEAIAEIEQETGRKVNTILQLRLHPSIIALREKVKAAGPDKIYDVKLQYMTSRGHWYLSSWKGDNAKAGGIATNIGIHFFDMLMWIFGDLQEVDVTAYASDHAAGRLKLKQANVEWFLSINFDHLPADVKAAGKRTFRTLTMEGAEIEFSDGFTDLHTKSYAEILKGNGFGIAEARPSLDLVYAIRQRAGIK